MNSDHEGWYGTIDDRIRVEDRLSLMSLEEIYGEIKAAIVAEITERFRWSRRGLASQMAPDVADLIIDRLRVRQQCMNELVSAIVSVIPDQFTWTRKGEMAPQMAWSIARSVIVRLGWQRIGLFYDEAAHASP